MKKIYAFVVFLVMAALAQAQPPKEKALLWKISGNGIAQPSYLYGTIHLMCPDQINVDKLIKRSFDATKQLFLEIKMDDPEMMAKTMQHIMMKNDTSLEDLVSKADNDSMNAVFKEKAGMLMSIMAKAKPMLLMSAVFPSLLGCSPEGWEKQFQDMAKAKGIPLKGLETIEYQLSVFDTIPYKVQADMLKDLLYHLDSTKKSFAEMLDVYLKKDINKLHKMTVSDPDFGSYEALMLNNRNNNWITFITAEAKQTPTFFAVGAAHLGGENGVISLLRKKGFTVTPVAN
ncbi:TraB/GumN family protein [Parasediminibacterium sp. JCM 36343]|uniref:TraB/GumN family protein n=1 Tax=Parasediminibacterium sp. JCM 36343 TaxID=3374279 RepID=UPI00397D7FAF